MRIFFLKVLILSIPLALFAGLLWLDITPSGERVIRVEAGESSPFVDHFLPSDRLTPLAQTPTGESYETIIKDPVYFSIHPPKTVFDTVEIELTFRAKNQPVVEMGPLVDPFSRTFDLRPLKNVLLDTLDWPHVQEGNLLIFSRKGEIEDVPAFLTNPPDRSTIATYHATLSAPVYLPDYTPLPGAQTVEATLRGDHKYLTYLKNEPFFLKGEFWDMNRTLGTDSGAIIVRDAQGNAVLSKEFADDGNTREDQTPGPQTVELSGTGLPEGVYSVELKATSDIFWHRLTTTQRYMTFVNELYLGDEIGYLSTTRPVSFVTNAKHLTLETYHGSAIQRVAFGDQNIDIAASHQPFHARSVSKGVIPVMIPKGDMQITGAGKFAFSSAMFFDPEPVRLTDDIDLDAQGIAYVIAEYQPPASSGNWEIASAAFSLEDVKTQDGAISFAVSLPGIADRGGTVDVQAVTVRFKKEPLTFLQVLRAVRERLPFGL